MTASVPMHGSGARKKARQALGNPLHGKGRHVAARDAQDCLVGARMAEPLEADEIEAEAAGVADGRPSAASFAASVAASASTSSRVVKPGTAAVR